MSNWLRQHGYGVRFEWGPAGAAQLAPHVACLVIIDVLSFTTSVTVAVDAGTRVYPYPWRDETAAAFARRHHAELAVGRRATTPEQPWSLSPATLQRAPVTARLVLPSPNGSAIAAAAAVDSTVIACCLRNATAVGHWLTAHDLGTPDRPIAVVAAGERWPDGTLRPALEDLLGAGALIATLPAPTEALSPEAASALTAYTTSADPVVAVSRCASGVELADNGFPEDVAIACDVDASRAVPILADRAFRPAPTG